jgi:superfamily I DNA/RNA helicase
VSIADIKAKQKQERDECLDAILKSDSNKKLIVAGPGTGKTFTFKRLLEKVPEGNNLALTFIRKLVEDMEPDLSKYAEVKTFHKYCKKVLHTRTGHFELVPYLTDIVKNDAELLGKPFKDFETKFRMLKKDAPEIAFYLGRGDYYDVVSFDDSVYRLYTLICSNPGILPSFGQIVIDEFQDFNPLEVAFISQLWERGPILIIGDDDQAVYEGRCASPSYLRQLHKSGEFQTFKLPFCTRCPQVIVDATNAAIEKANSLGHLAERIEKPFECYLEAKEQDSMRYPKIVVAKCSTATIIPKYVQKSIEKICREAPEDIEESHKVGDEYPTILIVGQKQYLQPIFKQLQAVYPNTSYQKPSSDGEYGIVEAYDQLLINEKANLGWRILMGLFFSSRDQKDVLLRTEDGTAMIECLDSTFIEEHLKAIEVIRKLKNGDISGIDALVAIQSIVGLESDNVVIHFTPTEPEEPPQIDKTQPSILLTSFVGCKGLSAGHVFIVGANNGSLPKNADAITDIEISQFIVALTRTRKQCHIVSNKWLFSPKDKNGKFVPSFTETEFLSWLPNELIDNRGELKAADFK